MISEKKNKTTVYFFCDVAVAKGCEDKDKCHSFSLVLLRHNIGNNNWNWWNSKWMAWWFGFSRYSLSSLVCASERVCLCRRCYQHSGMCFAAAKDAVCGIHFFFFLSFFGSPVVVRHYRYVLCISMTIAEQQLKNKEIGEKKKPHTQAHWKKCRFSLHISSIVFAYFLSFLSLILVHSLPCSTKNIPTDVPTHTHTHVHKRRMCAGRMRGSASKACKLWISYRQIVKLGRTHTQHRFQSMLRNIWCLERLPGCIAWKFQPGFYR